MRVLGIIPARGGSKGVPRKNIRLLSGKPLIAYTIEAAQAAKRLTRFVTTTDDEEIAEVARRCGSPVLMRPAELAADDTPMVPVIQDVLHRAEAEDGRYEALVLLQPTTPLRTADDIDRSIELLEDTGADSVISVYRVEDCHPARMYREVDGRLVPYDEEPTGRLRQNLPVLYHRNGAVYCCSRAYFEQGRGLIGADTLPYLMPRDRSLNIDDELDLRFTEFLVAQRRAPTHDT